MEHLFRHRPVGILARARFDADCALPLDRGHIHNLNEMGSEDAPQQPEAPAEGEGADSTLSGARADQLKKRRVDRAGSVNQAGQLYLVNRALGADSQHRHIVDHELIRAQKGQSPAETRINTEDKSRRGGHQTITICPLAISSQRAIMISSK